MCACFYLFGFSFFEFFVHSRCIITWIQKKCWHGNLMGILWLIYVIFGLNIRPLGSFTEILLVSCNCKHHHRFDCCGSDVVAVAASRAF